MSLTFAPIESAYIRHPISD